MRELSMHILDLAQNSIAAGANYIEIEVDADYAKDLLKISIRDNGKGMEPKFLAKVKDPFITTRSTRRIGLGIPMFNEAALAAGGGLELESEPGIGTTLVATFELSHIDRVPLGDMVSTLIALIAANPDIDFKYVHNKDGKEFILDTRKIKSELDGVPVNDGFVIKWISDYVRSEISGEMEIN